jgi:hypothetical protein
MIRNFRDAVIAFAGAAFAVAIATDTTWVALVMLLILAPWERCSKTCASMLDELTGWWQMRQAREVVQQRMEEMFPEELEERPVVGQPVAVIR